MSASVHAEEHEKQANCKRALYTNLKRSMMGPGQGIVASTPRTASTDERRGLHLAIIILTNSS